MLQFLLPGRRQAPVRDEFRNRIAKGARAAALALGLGLGLVMVSGTAYAQGVTLNLKDADINAVIATVSEITGKNFVVDPRVKGKVTVISSRPLEPDEVYQVFLSILNVHGFATVPGKNVIKIVPEVNAKQDDIPTVTAREPGKGDQYVTRVIQVENVAAAQLVPILRPLVPQQGHLAAYPPTNVLIASGGAGNIDRLVQIIRRIDLSSEAEIELIQLRHASAEEVVRILTSLEQNAAAGQTPQAKLKIVADVRTNSVLLGGDQATRLRLKAIITHLDTPLENSGNTRVIYLRYALAKDLVTVLTGVVASIEAEQAKGQAPKAAAGKINIQADEATNSLVINAPPDLMRDLESIIRQLDIRRAQVMVNAIIAEVSYERATELGVQWAYDGSDSNTAVGIINFAGSGSGLTNLLTDPPTIGDGLSLGVADGTSEDDFRLGALLRALAGDADTNVLATPTLVTMDNEEAEIVVGQNVPFVTGSYSGTSSGAVPGNPFQTIERKDVGLTLKVKPQINEGDAIKLEISHELSSLSAATTGASDIVTNKRALKTSVMVENDEILVLGGLIQDDLTESVQKVPGLGDIPVLGWLFSYKKTTKVKKNLMIFLHPFILRDSAHSMAVSGEKYNYIRARQMDIRERGVNLMDDEVSPLLPEWGETLHLPPPYEDATQPVQQLPEPSL